ncbi:MAG: hypothetical protein RLZZ352_1439 [Pseudomonadota bacterium]|jgi:DNA-binding transcriptional MerR regulator/methylmalonyl-CoA mutase cobalamin-binding subunit
MTNTSPIAETRHTIADVERDTGLSKDTLRVWERRYGFPTPARDALGERQYDDEQLVRLRHVRRLLDVGHRPSQVVALPLAQLLQMQSGRCEQAPALPAGPSPVRSLRQGLPSEVKPSPVADWMTLLRAHHAPQLRQSMQQYLLNHGLAALIRDGIAPMNQQVGQAWLDGQLAVFEEHLYTEVVQALLRAAMAQVSASQSAQSPRIVLTTVPGEPHALGLLMAECFMVLEACDTVALGVQTPLPDIVAAVDAYQADVLALSFSALQNPRDVRAALAQLRERLPDRVEIWVGGQSPALQRRPRSAAAPQRTSRTDTLDSPPSPPFWPMGQLSDIRSTVARWRAQARASHATVTCIRP